MLNADSSTPLRILQKIQLSCIPLYVFLLFTFTAVIKEEFECPLDKASSSHFHRVFPPNYSSNWYKIPNTT